MNKIVFGIFASLLYGYVSPCSINSCYGNSFIVKSDLPHSEAKEVLEYFGFSYSHQKSPGNYLIVQHRAVPTKSDVKFNITLSQIQQLHPKIEEFYQEEYIERVHRSGTSATSHILVINDAEWGRMWHLLPDTVPSMGVTVAWQRGYTGSGVVVAIIDDGADLNHPDLVTNIDRGLSFNFQNPGKPPTHEQYDLGHGTSCAGIIAAQRNKECSVGVAYDSKLAVLRVLDKMAGTTASLEAAALIHDLDHIHIYSNSWGPPDTGDIFAGSHDVTEAAILEGITKGRHGLGTIYTWAAGNGGQYRDDCNCDSFVNSVYTIAVQGVAMDTRPVYYAESCTAILTSTYSGDKMVNDTEIITSAKDGKCRDDFHGTSASCATAAGIIALTLQANDNLTWRDVQHLIVETASPTNLTQGNFITNGAGKRVSDYFGFGLLNADAMVTTALRWTPVGTRQNCSSGVHDIPPRPRVLGLLVSQTYDLICDIRHIEHVTVTVQFMADISGHVEIDLLSPQGTESKLLKPRPRDTLPRNITWTFMTVHSWGESAQGAWTLVVRNKFGSAFQVKSWKLDVYGTFDPPTTTTTSTTTTTTTTTTTQLSSTSTSPAHSSSASTNQRTTNHSMTNQNSLLVPGQLGQSSAIYPTSTSDVKTSPRISSKDQSKSDSESDPTLAVMVCVSISALVIILLAALIYMFYTTTTRIVPQQ